MMPAEDTEHETCYLGAVKRTLTQITRVFRCRVTRILFCWIPQDMLGKVANNFFEWLNMYIARRKPHLDGTFSKY